MISNQHLYGKKNIATTCLNSIILDKILTLGS